MPCAEYLAKEQAVALAQAAGAASVEVVLSRSNNQVCRDIDGDLFLDCQIIATASGRPDCRLLALGDDRHALFA